MLQVYKRMQKMREKYVDTLAKLYEYATTVYSKRTYTQWYDTKEGSYTYASFKSECDALSKKLTQYGIGSGDKVAIFSQSMPNWSVAFFATVAHGRISIPILPDCSENEVTNIINHSESKVIFVSKRLVGKISAEIMEKMGWEPVKLCSKEGLALLNGTQFMSAYGVYSLINTFRLSRWADTIGAMSLDAFDGRMEPFEHNVHAIRPHNGQIETARNIREILAGSEIIKQPKKHVQDPYSFRCIPQVHGAAKDTIAYVAKVLETEINSATDNPTVFPETDEIISAGNFHGEPIALPMDFLAIAVAELGNISERRIYRIISGARNLPNFLVANPGLNSGFMIPQYTAASIVSQSKGLCWPASCDSIPSSQGQEDHVSMGSNAATKLWKVVQNTERVLAIELMNAAQALEFRRPLRSSKAIEDIFAAYRAVVPFVDNDTVMYPHIATSVKFLNEHEPAC